MRRKMIRSISLTLTSILCLVVFHQAALAGPPLICHPFDIGNARSLTWSGSEWRAVDKGYNINRLVEDTLGLLTPETPVLVRMETLRRATVYGVWSMVDRKVGYSVKDAAVASELLSRLKARVPDPGSKSDKKITAIALFDYGYMVESYKQAGDGSQGLSLTGGIDGYGMIVKAIALGGGDPAMEFAAALAKEDRTGGHIAHLQKAVSRRAGRFIARAESALAFQQHGQDDWRASGNRREELEDGRQRSEVRSQSQLRAIPQPEGWGSFTPAYRKRAGGSPQSPNREVGDHSR